MALRYACVYLFKGDEVGDEVELGLQLVEVVEDFGQAAEGLFLLFVILHDAFGHHSLAQTAQYGENSVGSGHRIGEQEVKFVGAEHRGDLGCRRAYAVLTAQIVSRTLAQVVATKKAAYEVVAQHLDEVGVVIARSVGLTVEGQQAQHKGVDAAVGKGIAHSDVDAVVGVDGRQGAEGGYKEALVGEDDGRALGVGEPVGMVGEELAGILALQHILRTLDDVHLTLALTEERRPMGDYLGEVLVVGAQETAGLLHGVGIVVGVGVGEQRTLATPHIFRYDAPLAFRQGVEADEVEGLVRAAVGKGGYVLGHMAVGHSAIGLAPLGEEGAQLRVVLEERMVELQIVALEGAHVGVLHIPLKDVLYVVQVDEELTGVDTIAVYLGEVGEHHVAEGYEVLEGLVLAVVAADSHVYEVKLKEQELVGDNPEAAELCHKVVDDCNLRQEECGAVLGGELLESAAEEELGAMVVEYNEDPVGIARVLTQYARRYLAEVRIHCFASSRVSGLPTSSQRLSLWI